MSSKFKNEIKITNTYKKNKKMQTQKYNLFPENKSETTIRSIKFPHNRNDGQMWVCDQNCGKLCDREFYLCDFGKK